LRAQYTELSIVLCLALIASPISWTHYYLFLLLPLSLYFGNKLDIPNRGVWFSLMAASALLISPPVVIVGNNLSILGPLASKLLISHYLFGGLLLLGILLAARLRGTGVYQESLVRATANDPELNRTSPINSKKELEKGGYRTH
jgi:hypothetical protein